MATQKEIADFVNSCLNEHRWKIIDVERAGTKYWWRVCINVPVPLDYANWSSPERIVRYYSSVNGPNTCVLRLYVDPRDSMWRAKLREDMIDAGTWFDLPVKQTRGTKAARPT